MNSSHETIWNGKIRALGEAFSETPNKTVRKIVALQAGDIVPERAKYLSSYAVADNGNMFGRFDVTHYFLVDCPETKEKE